MLRSLKKLAECKVSATDGDVGSVHDALLDETHWAVRLLVVDTGNWLAGRRVVVSPVAVVDADWEHRRITLRLTREQVESSPPIDPELPVTREQETKHYQHHGWPFYWGGTKIWGDGVTPMELAIAAVHPGVMPAAAEEQQSQVEEQERSGVPHLRSARELQRASVEAIDGAAGSVEDLLMDDSSWRIRYLVLRGAADRGEDVLLMTEDIAQLRPEDRIVYTDLPRDEIQRGPVWDPEKLAHSDPDPGSSGRSAERRPGRENSGRER